MLITKANLSVALATPKMPGDGDEVRGLALEHIQIDPEHETVTATSGLAVHISRIDVPEHPAEPEHLTEPVYLPAAKAKKLAATIGSKSLGLSTSHNRDHDHDWASLGPVILTPDISWPDINCILQKSETEIENEITISSTISLDELTRMVDAFDNHDVQRITIRVRGAEKPLVVKSRKDDGHTLTAYIQPL